MRNNTRGSINSNIFSLLLDNILVPIVAMLIFLLVWESIVRGFGISPLILPPPTAVCAKLIGEIGYFLKHAGITMFESVLGFLLGTFTACLLAILFQFSSMAEKALYPYAIAFKAIPLVALAPLVVVWFGTGLASKVVLAAIISFFPILVNYAHGLRSVEQEALDLMTTLSASGWQIFLRLRLPHSLPYLFAGMKISSSFAVIGAVVAEFVGSQSGIGFVVKSSSYYLETESMFAAIIIAGVSGLSFFGAVSMIERWVVFWNNETQTQP